MLLVDRSLVGNYWHTIYKYTAVSLDYIYITFDLKVKDIGNKPGIIGDIIGK